MKETTPLNTSDFLEETIKTRPLNRKRLLRRALEVVAFAILFGFIAYITMLIASKALTERLFPEPTNEVTFTDESNSYTTQEIEPEDMLLEEVEGDTLESGEEKLLEMVGTLQEIATNCDGWLVQVTGVTQETSWLDSTATSENTSSGAIIADNGMELLVLTRNKSIEKANRIEVKLADDVIVNGTVKGIDKNFIIC